MASTQSASPGYARDSGSLAAKYSQRVLYDSKKMFPGEQDQRIKEMLRLGKSQIGYNIKVSKDERADLPLSQQMLVFRDAFMPFYKNKAINIITEEQIKAGKETIDLESVSPIKDSSNKEDIHYNKNKYTHTRGDAHAEKAAKQVAEKLTMPGYMVGSVI